MRNDKTSFQSHYHLDKTTSDLHYHFADWQCEGFDHGLAPQSLVFESRPLPGQWQSVSEVRFQQLNSWKQISNIHKSLYLFINLDMCLFVLFFVAINFCGYCFFCRYSFLSLLFLSLLFFVVIDFCRYCFLSQLFFIFVIIVVNQTRKKAMGKFVLLGILKLDSGGA